MNKYQKTISCKIEYLKRLVANPESANDVFYGDDDLKKKIISSLLDKEWVINNNGVIERNVDVKLDEYCKIKNDHVPRFEYPSEDWVKSNIAKHLKTNGYEIVYIAWGKDKGTDIIGFNTKTKRFINIEAKGGSSSIDTVTPEGNNYYECIGQIISSISDDEDYAVAFPWRRKIYDKDGYGKHYDVYGERWNNLSNSTKKKLGLSAFFVDKNGYVCRSDSENKIEVDGHKGGYDI